MSKRRGQKLVYGGMLTEGRTGIGDENALAAFGGEWRRCASRCDILLVAQSNWKYNGVLGRTVRS